MKNPQYERLKRINERLNRWGGRPVPKAELLAICGVSERTLKEDIAFLRLEYQASVSYCRREKGYFYASPFDLMAQLSLTPKDFQTLDTAVAALGQFKELPLFEDLRGTVDKIENAVKFRFRPSLQSHRIQFESAPSCKGIELIGPFLQWASACQAVEFDYQKHEDVPLEHYDLHPYLVKEYRNRWYVLGFCPRRDGLRIFGLDRILPESLLARDEYFDFPDFDARHYFSQALGIAIYEEEPQEVVLSMTVEQGRFFKAQPFFPFAEEDVLIEGGEEFRVRFPQIIINQELVMEVARWGNRIKVVSPDSLRDQVKNYLRNALALY